LQDDCNNDAYWESYEQPSRGFGDGRGEPQMNAAKEPQAPPAPNAAAVTETSSRAPRDRVCEREDDVGMAMVVNERRAV
jgi:hypothetical protein